MYAESWKMKPGEIGDFREKQAANSREKKKDRDKKAKSKAEETNQPTNK